MSEVTGLLNAIGRGDLRAADELLKRVYGELRAISEAKMARERQGHTLSPTDLVNEAYVRLFPEMKIREGDFPRFENSRHFFGAAAQAMGQILVDYARKRKAAKRVAPDPRAAGKQFESPASDSRDDFLIALDEALTTFANEHPRKAELVRLRYYVGFKMQEVADVLGISLGTAEKDWTFAKVWLRRQLEHNGMRNSLPE